MFLPISSIVLFVCCWKFVSLQTKLLLILFQKFLIACNKLPKKTVLPFWFKCNPFFPKCFSLMFLLSAVWIYNSLINLFVFRMVVFAFVLSVFKINLLMISQHFGSSRPIFRFNVTILSTIICWLVHCWYWYV